MEQSDSGEDVGPGAERERAYYGGNVAKGATWEIVQYGRVEQVDHRVDVAAGMTLDYTEG